MVTHKVTRRSPPAEASSERDLVVHRVRVPVVEARVLDVHRAPLVPAVNKDWENGPKTIY